MRNKDTGEFELVVGDKQLLSGFFLGVVLLAVVFALGYVLGRGSQPSKPGAETASASTPNGVLEPRSSASPVPASQIPATTTTAPDASASGATPATSTPPAEPPPQPTTVPAREVGAPAPAAAAPAPAPAKPEEAAPGSYWQVMAGSQGAAETLLNTLKKEGFPVTTRPGPNSLTLVWVGPYTDRDSLSRAKTKLQDAGLTNIFKKP